MSYKINSFIPSKKDVVSTEKRLSICLLPNGFSFSVTTLHDELLSVGEVECDINAPMSDLVKVVKSAFEEMQIQPFGLKECELIVFSRQFVWVPIHLYDEKNDKSYLEALCHIPGGSTVYADFNESIKAMMVFADNSNAVAAFKIVIPRLKVRCQHSKLVDDSLLELSDLKSLILIHVRKDACDIEVVCNKKLLLSNTFDSANFDEVMFHTMNVAKQFHLEEAMLTTAICGEVGREEYAKIRRFLPNVSLYTGRPLKLTNPEMQHLPTYRHAVVLS